MKRKIAAVSMTLLTGILLYFTGIHNGTAHDTGAPAGYSGSPYDGRTCDYSGCHTSYPLQIAQAWISSNVSAYGFLPDSVYTITAKSVYIGNTSFGFEISPQTPSGTAVGTLIVTDATTTQIVTSHSLQYMTHTIHSYQGTDSVVWTFEWRAPVTLTDSVIFYGSFNCGNGNSSAAGAYIYPATLVIHESKTAGIGNIQNLNNSFAIFPNPARQQINISYNITDACNVEINMYALDGKKLSNLMNNMDAKGEHSRNITLPSSINPGIYFIQLIANGQSTVQKIMVE
jgi:hypothetical protein